MMFRAALIVLVIAAGAHAACKDQKDCKDCLSQKFCGWCSPSSTVFDDGRPGSQCQDQHETGWHCNHLYSTDTCLIGYVCDGDSGTCKQDPSGGTGDTKANCEKMCHKRPAGLSKCNVKSSTCEPCNDYCKTNTDCKVGSYCSGGLCHGSTCQQNTTCAATCSADTPDVLIGTWRGLQIQAKFSAGEYDMKFQKKAQGPQVSFRPSLGDVSTGSLTSNYASGGRDLTLMFDAGPLSGVSLNGAFNPWEPSPETEQTAFYFGAPGADAPADIHVAMNGTGSTVYALQRCGHGAVKCDFDSVFPAAQSLLEAMVAPMIVDPCNVNKGCSSCIGAASGVCGWCSTDVQYKDGTPGAQCAGFDSTGKPLGWQCLGVFSKSDCSDYGCDFTDVKNPKCTKGNGTSTKEECAKLCKAPDAMFSCDSTTKKCNPCDMHYCTNDKQCPGSYCNKAGFGPWSCHGGAGPGCESNASCTSGCGAEETYAICDTYAGKCNPVPKGTPGAVTKYECSHKCIGAKPLGTWRAVAINAGFTRGEYDFTFYDDNTLHWRDAAGKVTVVALKGSEEPVEVGAVSVEGTVTKSNDPSIKGKKVYALFKHDDQGDDKIAKNLFFGLGFAPVKSFGVAQANLDFVQVGCKDSTECNFDSVVVP